MISRPLLLVALLCLAPLATPAAQAEPTDLLGCALSPIVLDAFCQVGFGPSCTSTSACIGFDFSEIGKTTLCVDSVCTLWIPDCVGATVWFQNWPDQPIFKKWGCVLSNDASQVVGLP